MNFGLLLSQLPQVTVSRTHDEAMLSLDTRQPALVRPWRRLRSFVRP